MLSEYPHPTSPTITRVMKGNRRVDTKPETALRSALHQSGLRFRKDFRIALDGSAVRPDIVFTRARVAVFVDGCFWHHCPEHGRIPGGANAQYWEAKLTRNQQRDTANTAALVEAGWAVVRIWEHVPLEDAAREVKAALKRAVGGTKG